MPIKLEIISNKERDKIFIPFHKNWVQLTKKILTKTSSNLYENSKSFIYYVYQIPWEDNFDLKEEYDENNNLIKESYLIENFEFLCNKSENKICGDVINE